MENSINSIGAQNPKPLVVDLDGTLIHSDMLHESAIRVLRDQPLKLLLIPALLLKGKAKLKTYLAEQTAFDPSTLPYNQELILWLRNQKESGRKIILCTASHRSIAIPIAEHLGIFDQVIATGSDLNIAGKNKANALVDQFGKGGFDYVGDSRADITVWEKASEGITVNASQNTIKGAQRVCNIASNFPKKNYGPKAILKMLRVHQWLKNILLFAPLLAAHQFNNWQGWISLCLAFIAFSLCASSVYIANDLLDLESDRRHPRKSRRPFASGAIPIWVGVLLSPALLIVSLMIASNVNTSFMGWLTTYFVITCAYSWGLKRLVLIDCITLAILYTLRIVAGASAIQNNLSFWLLAFSIFLFLSLAFVKRYAELEGMENSLTESNGGNEKIHGRGYYAGDAPIIQTLGIASGYAAVIVFALYLNSDAVIKLYPSPEFVWGEVPILLFWISWVWIKTHRGDMYDDPLIFAIKDKVSRLTGLAFAAVLLLSTRGPLWWQ
jgi:4-hydroxybenzoate polyprenyltransferase/phosphoserine phosphatase